MTSAIIGLHLHGPGRAATGIARMAQRVGVSVRGLSGGEEAGAAAAREVLGEVPWTRLAPDLATLEVGTLVVVGVPDDAIALAANELAAATTASVGRSVVVAHLAGLRGASVLTPVTRHDAVVAAFHPMRSFSTRATGGEDLDGALVAIESDDARIAAALQAFALSIGGRPFELAPGMRALYHLGASTAGNAVLGVLDVARAAFEAAGVPDDLATSGLATLVRGALDNAARTDLALALTGPVARGDADTVARHLEAIDATLPGARGLYLELIRHQLALCDRRADSGRADAVRKWLGQETSS